MVRALKRLLAFFGWWWGHQPPVAERDPYAWRLGHQPPGAERDPYAWRPVPRKPRPKTRSGAVAVAEPDE